MLVADAWLEFQKRKENLHRSKEPYRLCKKECETEKDARAQQRVVEPFMNE
jgi:hypothetical protein